MITCVQVQHTALHIMGEQLNVIIIVNSYFLILSFHFTDKEIEIHIFRNHL